MQTPGSPSLFSPSKRWSEAASGASFKVWIGLLFTIATVVALVAFGPLAFALAALLALAVAAALSGLVADRGRELRDRNGNEVVR